MRKENHQIDLIKQEYIMIDGKTVTIIQKYIDKMEIQGRI